VEPAARATFLAVAPCLVATWALGGFYLSLGPSLSLLLAHSVNRLVGAVAVAVLFAAGGAASLVIRAWPAVRMMLTGCAAPPAPWSSWPLLAVGPSSSPPACCAPSSASG
jgi:hypothetical protein